MMMIILIICLLFVSSSAFKKIKFNKPNCNLYYMNNVHKYMLQNQKPKNSLVINNMLIRFSKHSGQTVGHIIACITTERNVNKK